MNIPDDATIYWPKYWYHVGLHRISYPAPAGYEVGFDHLSMHLPHCVIGQEFIDLQIS